MKAWQVKEWCEPEGMALEEIPIPVPGPRQVLIRNAAAALNFFDILQVQGKYQIKPPFPFTPGAEVAGTIAAVGNEVTQFSLGDSVLAILNGGGFAEYSLSDAIKTFPIPDGMSVTEAAALPIVYQTSYYALTKRTQSQPGEWLLVHAGASGVGMSAIQIGRALGARIIATAGSEEKLAFCLEQGAEHVINYRDPSWVDRVKAITGKGADVIYDPVGGSVFDLSTKCIAPQGRLLVVGFASGQIPTIAVNRILIKDISIVGVLWGGYSAQHPEYSVEVHRALADMYAAGQIHPQVGAKFTLAEAPRALRSLAQREIIGKAILTDEES